jgi:hypothetical protein
MFMNISDKLMKVDETVTIQMYDNGFLFEISGRDHEDDWSNVKILCSSMEDINRLLTEATSIERT